jgi:hypothetical protein
MRTTFRPARRPATPRIALLLGGLFAHALAACAGHVEGFDEVEPPSGGPSAPAAPGAPSPGPGQAPGAAPGTPAPAGPGAALPPVSPGVPGVACTPVAPQALARVWLLTQAQYKKTVATLFAGRSPDRNAMLPSVDGVAYPLGFVSEADRFTTRAASYFLRDNELAEVWAAAGTVASRLVADASVAPCAASAGAAFDACADSVIKAKGELMFRRPLTAAEAKKYVAIATSSAALTDRRTALATAFEAMLVAPQFLFRVEAGTPGPSGTRRLTPFEIASALSYGITDGPPDRPLWDAAASGALADARVIGQHVERLAGTDLGALAPLRAFVAQLLRYGAATEVAKKEKGHDAGQLVKETDLVVKDVLTANGRKDLLGGLLGSTVAYTSKVTAAVYGTTSTASSPVKIAATGDRVGLLAQPSWLVAYSQNERNDPPKRGRFVMEELLCQSVPKAPIGVVTALPASTSTTLREKLVQHRKDPSCAACHQLMDPIGLAFEAFDHLGAPRTTEAGRPVDVTGQLVGTGDQDGPFDGVRGLTAKLVASRRTAGCFARHSLEYWFGREADAGDQCAIAAAVDAYAQSQGDALSILRALFTSDAFLVRKG